jgi:transketolase
MAHHSEPTETDDAVVARSIDTIRALAMDTVQKASSGHPGTAMALAPLAYTLFTRFIRADPTDPHWPDRDRFVLSSGHASVLQYSLLHLTGYDLSLEDLRQFRQWGSRTPGHPERGHTPGIEVTTGPLGQGIGNAVGLALAERFLGERYGRPGEDVAEPLDHHVYAICSDGDLMEGISQEAAGIAGQLALGKLVLCYDDNRITIDGTTSISFTAEDHGKRFEALGWHVQHVADSEDLDALHDAIAAARDETERPSLIVIRSHIAYPAPNAVDTARSHGAALGEDEVRATKEIMGFDPDAHFAVEQAVAEHMDQRPRGARLRAEWERRFAAWSDAHPDLRAEWDRAWRGELAPGWRDALPVFQPGEKIATRSAGQKVMAAFAPYAPTMLGGAADLVESTKTSFEGAGQFSAVHAGRNVPFGIREHGMGAIVNGAAAHGGIVSPYGSTFLIFSDYMRASVRLSALSKLPAVWAWTHDSVGLGEDGPTHQPVEHYMALRAIPDLWFIRPADANETSVAWRVALERTDGPVALALSRQSIPVLDRGEVASAEGLLKGAYVLWDAGGEDGRDPDVILIATGAEVGPTLAAARSLAGEGTRARVVSMPCWELFQAQSQAYRDEVLPPDVRVRLSVEPGVTLGWREWVGDHGDTLGIDRFGASAPGTRVLEELGFTPEAIAARAAALLQRTAETRGQP